MSRSAAVLLTLATFPAFAAGDPPKLSADEEAVVNLTNEARKKADLKPLKPHPRLMEAARRHAENMARQGKLEHTLDEKSPSDRVTAAGYAYRLVGENIAWNQKGPKEAVAGWLDSEPHRDNILKADYTEIGVAVARSEKGEPYWVQVFGTPKE